MQINVDPALLDLMRRQAEASEKIAHELIKIRKHLFQGQVPASLPEPMPEQAAVRLVASKD